jgi:hypothetical protein
VLLEHDLEVSIANNPYRPERIEREQVNIARDKHDSLPLHRDLKQVIIVRIPTLPLWIRSRRSAIFFPNKELIQRFVSMTARTSGSSLPDGLHLGGDLLHGYRRVLEFALDLPHLVEQRLVVEIAGECLLLFLGESVNEVLYLGKFKI